MRKTKGLVYRIIQVAALVALAIGMVVLFRAVSGNRNLGPLAQEASPSPTAVGPDQAYPPPGETSPPPEATLPPTVEYIELTPGEFFPPTDTPYPTFTLYPSPTLRPGPTDTPIPMIEPAPDASGNLTYFSRQSGNIFSFNSITMNADGEKEGPPSPIFSNVDIPELTFFPSPDGNRFMLVDDWGKGIVFNTDSGKAELPPDRIGIYMEEFFNWYPDNHKILIRANYRSLWLADLINGEFTPLAVPGTGDIDGAAASPNGKNIVYSHSRGAPDSSELWLVSSNGRDAKLIHDFPGGLGFFSWSPDGKQIVFLGDGWMVMIADGSNLRQLGHLGLPACLQPPLWSPDSRLLAIVVSASSESSCEEWSEAAFKETNILLIDVESGKNYPLLTDGSTGNIDPAWSPDGKQIAFVSNRSGAPEIWAVNVDGTNLRQLTSAGGYVRFPIWRKP